MRRAAHRSMDYNIEPVKTGAEIFNLSAMRAALTDGDRFGHGGPPCHW